MIKFSRTPKPKLGYDREFESPQDDAERVEVTEELPPDVVVMPAPADVCTHTHSEKMNGYCKH